MHFEDNSHDLSRELSSEFRLKYSKSPYILCHLEDGILYQNCRNLHHAKFSGRMAIYRKHIRAFIDFKNGQITKSCYFEEFGTLALARIFLLDRYQDKQTTVLIHPADVNTTPPLIRSKKHFERLLEDVQNVLFEAENRLNLFARPYQIAFQNQNLGMSNKKYTGSGQSLLRLCDEKRSIIDLLLEHPATLFTIIEQLKEFYSTHILSHKKQCITLQKTETLLPHPSKNEASNCKIFSQLSPNLLSISEEETLKTQIQMRPLPSELNQKVEKTEKSIRLKAWVVEQSQVDQSVEERGSFRDHSAFEISGFDSDWEQSAEPRSSNLNQFLDRINNDRKAQLVESQHTPQSNIPTSPPASDMSHPHSISIKQHSADNFEDLEFMRPKTKEIWHKFRNIFSH